MKIIRINKGKALPLPFRFIGAAIITLSVIKALQGMAEPWSVVLSIVLSTFLPAIWFSSNLIIVDNDNHIIFDGVWIMGFKVGKPVRFNSIEKLYANRVKTKKTMYSLANNQHVVTDFEYRAYLKIENGETFFLFSHPLEERVEEKLMKIRSKLGIEFS